MTRLLISTALAGLLATSVAFAQDDHRGGDRGGPAPSHPPAAAPAARGPAPAARHDDHRGPPPSAGPSRGAPPAGPPAGRPDDRRGGGPRANANGPARGAPAATPANRGNPGPRSNGANRNAGPAPNAGPRANFRAFNRNVTAQRHFHAPAYRRPSGWYAQRWTYGEILPPLFWASDYWINDFYDFGLAPPPPGTVWVRDGNDALLIDRYSGEIIQVDYGVFY